MLIVLHIAVYNFESPKKKKKKKDLSLVDTPW